MEDRKLEDVFAGHVEITAAERVYVRCAIMAFYVYGGPESVGYDHHRDRREMHRSVMRKIIGSLTLKEVTTDSKCASVTEGEQIALMPPCSTSCERARFGRGLADGGEGSPPNEVNAAYQRGHLAAAEVRLTPPIREPMVTVTAERDTYRDVLESIARLAISTDASSVTGRAARASARVALNAWRRARGEPELRDPPPG